MRCFCLVTAIATVCPGQGFEGASIRVSDNSQEKRSVSVDVKPGTVTMRNVNLPFLIVWSHKISPYQITGATGWNSEHYDIVAKAAGPAKADEMRVMMQALLAERFKLASHRETKDVSAYALVEAKGGHKLQEADEADGPGINPIPGKMALAGKGTGLAEFAAFISDPLRAPVIDMTGLKGRYDFTFDITQFVPRGPRQAGEPEPDPVAVMQVALPKQLGLKLEARKMPVEMLVIDHIEKAPVEN